MSGGRPTGRENLEVKYKGLLQNVKIQQDMVPGCSANINVLYEKFILQQPFSFIFQKVNHPAVQKIPDYGCRPDKPGALWLRCEYVRSLSRYIP